MGGNQPVLMKSEVRKNNRFSLPKQEIQKKFSGGGFTNIVVEPGANENRGLSVRFEAAGKLIGQNASLPIPEIQDFADANYDKEQVWSVHSSLLRFLRNLAKTI
jgi:hypothetical protein